MIWAMVRALSLFVVLTAPAPVAAQTAVGEQWLVVERLPIHSMSKIVQEDGSVIYLSTNRRFAFRCIWKAGALVQKRCATHAIGSD
jgi:hypothetical protein